MSIATQSGAGALQPRNCVCYVTDQGYLFPSLMSASQARQNVSPDKTDVVIYYVGPTTSKSELFQSICQNQNIKFARVLSADIDNMHVMFGRLFLDRFMTSNYQHILYIDGDTQIADNLDPLVDVKLPNGMFCAARDPMALAINWKNRVSADQRKYFETIGLSPDRVVNYFNSGVLRADRQGWAEISSRTLELIRSRGSNFRFPDQDALNLVAAERYLTMSFKWNFPVFLLNTGLDKIVKPRIYHFMSNPRPWQGSFQPWGRKWHSTYQELVAKHPELGPHKPGLPAHRYLKYFLQQHYKKRVETVIWRSQEIFDKTGKIETEAFL
jgi:lipopolysaccharide biosynthesis glycosyltransferase